MHASADNEWAGALQFGTFNRMRMCPVLEVRISGSRIVEAVRDENVLF